MAQHIVRGTRQANR